MKRVNAHQSEQRRELTQTWSDGAPSHGHDVVQQSAGSLALAARGVSAVVANLSAACYQQGAWLLAAGCWRGWARPGWCV